ncbi:MAG: sugar phosphate isomerase/epimerase family protein [Armatimonadota bacterium]|nr:sugar phosphate isomerase/epimerase family protein [Armatimonadota bacterium]
MKIGIGSYTYTWSIGVRGHAPDRPMTASDLLSKANEMGAEVVQICDNVPLHKLSESEIASVRAYADSSNIEIEVGTRGVKPHHMITYLTIAKQLGSRLVRVVIDTEDDHPRDQEVVARIKSVLPEFERSGVAIAIENHDRFPARSLARIVETVGSPFVGICLDTVNSFGALEGPEVVIETLAHLTLSLHLKDFEIRRADHQMGFVIEGTPLGKGRLDVPWLLDRIRSAGRDPNAIIELWTPPEEKLSQTIAKEDAWAHESFLFLRELTNAAHNAPPR